MIYLIGQAPSSPYYTQGDFDVFLAWLQDQPAYQFDIETDVVPSWSGKKLITLQFGNIDGTRRYVIQKSALTEQQWEQLKQALENRAQMKLIHNAMFECVVMRFYDVLIENVYDTMLAEKILTGGLYDDESTYALADLALKYVCRVMDKTEQTTFGDNVLTESKVLYAAADVQDLGSIYRMQVPQLGHHDLDWVAALEMEVLISYAEMTYNGLELDQVAWLANLDLVEPLIKEAQGKLDAWCLLEPFKSRAIALGYLSEEDRMTIKWTAPRQREQLLQLLFPDLEGASIGVVRKYVKTHTDHRLIAALSSYAEKDYSLMENVLVKEHRDQLIEWGMLIPANTVQVNWNSVPQVLPLLQAVEPKLKSLSKDALADAAHPIVEDLKEYKDNLKLDSSYGEAFIKKFVEPDGKVRTSFNQIVSTGRVSSQKPNMQNIPAKESVGNRYRNCFIAPEGWRFVDSDYSSQELVCIAYLSKDPVWQDALEKGQDLHSVAAEVVYGRKWKDAAESGCAYYHLNTEGKPSKEKCKCKKHKTMRQACKTINFGLAYGMSKFKLARTLKITVQEAAQLIEDYFKAFPKIKRLLDFLGRFGVQHGYSKTMAPFFRKRWYPSWKFAVHAIEAHLSDVEYNTTLGAIERQAKNQPIQGSSADMIKLATVFIRWYIVDNGLRDKVRLVVQVHDQNTSVARDDYAEEWKPLMTMLMEDAAKVFIASGLLKSETNITQRWSK